MADKVAKMQRNFALRLYKAVLSTHRALPAEMRAVGDIYVREEFKLHKNAKPEHLQPFFDQWLQYLQHMSELTSGKTSPEEIGTNLEYAEIDALPEEKKEKLYNMHDETARLFSGNYTAADMGLGEEHPIPEETAVDQVLKVDKVSGIHTTSVKTK